MSERVFILHRWIRVWHWTNAFLILCLLVTGASLHYSSPEFSLIKFSIARRIHNLAGYGLAFTYGYFFLGNIVSGNWWQFVPNPKGFAHRAWLQIKFYVWGIFIDAPHPFPTTPEQNLNPLQQVSYWVVMYVLMPLLIISGLIYLYPTIAPDRWLGVDGLLPIALLHYVVAFCIFLFLLLHLYLCTTGEKLTSMIRMMITGWHEG